jgi:hypothetical protein
MIREQEAMSDAALASRLRAITDQLPEGGVAMADLRDVVGQDGLMLLTAFMTIIFMVPVSIPGVSTVFGAAILMIGVSRLFGQRLWLPRAVERRTVPSDGVRKAFERGFIWVQRLERVSRPGRLPRLTSSGLMRVFTDAGLVLGAVLLMMPFGLIPLSNTLPAIALLFFAIGILQRDGVCILLGHVSNVVTMIYFAVLIGGGGMVLQRAWQYFSA